MINSDKLCAEGDAMAAARKEIALAQTCHVGACQRHQRCMYRNRDGCPVSAAVRVEVAKVQPVDYGWLP